MNLKSKMNTMFRHTGMLLIVAITATIFTACINEDTDAYNDGRVTMPVRLSIPATNVTRTPGDPGLAEGINLPLHAYIFVVIGYTSSGSTTYTYYYRHILLDESKWSDLLTWNGTEPQSFGDAYYEYRGNITFTLPAQRTEGRVYAAVSCKPIAFTEPTTDPEDFHITSSITEEDIKKLKVDFTEGGNPYSANTDLRDVYSTPSDYTISGNYYGTINDISERVPNLDLHLYHVAARLDILWNVTEDQQTNVKLSDMRLTGLKYKDCYIFQPTMNVGAGTSTHTLDGPVFDPGNQWYGRHCFYIIPYRVTDAAESYYPFTVELWQNGDTKTSKTTGYYEREFRIAAQPSSTNHLLGTGTIFSPWLRGELKITGTLY